MASIRQQRAALERVIDLALFLAAHPDRLISGAVIKAEVYDKLLEKPQDMGAFRRMLNRDRDDLEAAGLHIIADNQGNYLFDPRQNYAADLDLSPAERAAAALAAAALADDPLFPLPVALRLALVKLSRVLNEDGVLLDGAVAARSNLAARKDDEHRGTSALCAPEEIQKEPALLCSRWTELILHAQLESRCLDLRYRNQDGRRSERQVAPYGLFLLSGQWYLVGFDSLRADIRVFTVARIEELRMTQTPFALPDDFSVERWRQLPFRLSSAPRDREAQLLIPATRAPEAAGITHGKGTIEPQADGSLLWKIPYPSAQQDQLVRYALEQGLSFTAKSTAERAALRRALEKVVCAHA
ncbi:MAG: WYL domain-containing protein [Actinomycetia bacterium]|nr:WYL domain-containing protein [Actinomycetes bacterium]